VHDAQLAGLHRQRNSSSLLKQFLIKEF